jgi:hypothetical protein
VNRRVVELDESKLDQVSRLVLREFADHPDRRVSNVTMELRPDGSASIVIAIPSPTGDSRRAISIWLDEKLVPTLEFGAWHTHADLWNRDLPTGVQLMLAYLERITDGEILLAESPTVAGGLFRVVDVCDREEILEELTSPHNPPGMRLLSWSGAEDGELSDFREGPA